MDALLGKLGRRLTELDDDWSPSAFAVAFSGGLDSTVLLAACQRLDLARPLRALHVDHGLHPQSAQWARHCAAVADALGVDFATTRVAVRPDVGQSLEAAARAERYSALAGLMAPGEMVLTAHHEDDQLETVLLRLFRGAGVRGLRGILAGGAWGRGFLGRPLLGCSRAEILAVARAWALRWLEDPSNRDRRFDRNYLRADVLPLIKARWPGVAATVARAARQLADAEALLAALAARDAAGIDDARRIPLAALRPLEPSRQRNLLRHLIAAAGLPLPSARQLAEITAAVARSRRDAKTVVTWPGAEARVYADHLYLMTPLPSQPPGDAHALLRPGEPWTGAVGRLELVECGEDGEDRPGLPEAWARAGLAIRFRRGGERLKPVGRAHHRTLKKLFQEAHVVPWMRSRIPLLYRGDELVAVGDLWTADAARASGPTGRVWCVRWTEHGPLH